MSNLDSIISPRTFRQGMHDLKVWPGIEADGSVQTTTPGKTPGKEDQMSRLAKVSKVCTQSPIVFSRCLLISVYRFICENINMYERICASPSKTLLNSQFNFDTR